MNFLIIGNDEKRKFGLDIFRALAIVLVMISHGRYFLITYWDFTKYFSIGGFLGVELFFVLSGFLIGQILIRKYTQEQPFHIKAILHFWKRRWFRTLPNYYLVLLLNLIIYYKLLNASKFQTFNLKYLYFCQNIKGNHPSFFRVAWSLSVEEWFYLLFPIILFVFTLLFFKMTKKNVLLLVTMGFIVFFTFLRLYTVIEINPHWNSGIRKAVMLRLDSIMYGVLAAYIKIYHNKIWIKVKSMSAILGIVIIVLLSIHFFESPKYAKGFFSKTFAFSFISLGAAFLLPFADSMKTPSSGIWKIITLISLISYSAYLIHHSIVMHLMLIYFKPVNEIYALVFFAFYWIISLLLSYIVFVFYEKPVMDLRDRF